MFSEKCQSTLITLSQEYMNTVAKLKSSSEEIKQEGKNLLLKSEAKNIVVEERVKKDMELSNSMYNSAMPVDDDFNLE